MENFRITLRRKHCLSEASLVSLVIMEFVIVKIIQLKRFVSFCADKMKEITHYSAKGLFVSFWSITKENRQPAFASFWTDKMKGIPFLHKDYTVVAVRYTD